MKRELISRLIAGAVWVIAIAIIVIIYYRAFTRPETPYHYHYGHPAASKSHPHHHPTRKD